MARSIPRPTWFRRAAVVLLPLLTLVVGCSTTLNRNAAAVNPPLMKVRLLAGQEQIALVASTPPVYRTDGDRTPHALNLPANSPVVVQLKNHSWTINGTTLGQGTLTIQPAKEGSVLVGSATPTSSGAAPAPPRAYRGIYLLVPTGETKFDVVNQVDIEGYLAGVLPREMLKNWNVETYKAQAIVARTYALYEKASHDPSRHWDVWADERSQVYGGLTDETDKSLQAVNETMGIVVTYSANGRDPRIFKAYFSSCCGGIQQSVSDAFGEAAIDPLREQNNGGTCSASPRYDWGPVVVGRRELARRIRAWGKSRDRTEKNLDAIADVAIYSVNPFNRPTRFVVRDAKGTNYYFLAEEFRAACNYDASGPTAIREKATGAAPTLYSSFVKIIIDQDNVRFVEGHGFGHGVGLCQYCSERRAEEGMAHEDIVLAAYPHAKLMRAY